MPKGGAVGMILTSGGRLTGYGFYLLKGKPVFLWNLLDMEHTIPVILAWDEAFDIGSDTETGVNDADYLPPFKLTAELNKLTIKVDRPKLSEADIKKLQDGQAAATDNQ